VSLEVEAKILDQVKLKLVLEVRLDLEKLLVEVELKTEIMKKVLELVKLILHLVKLILHLEKLILVLENLKLVVEKVILEAEVKMKLELENKRVIIHY
jgi:hypothetical protein